MTHVHRTSRGQRLTHEGHRFPAAAKADPLCVVMAMFSAGGDYDCGSTPLLDTWGVLARKKE